MARAWYGGQAEVALLPGRFAAVLIATARHRSAVAGLVGALLLSVLAVVPVAANSTPQALPFAQDWTNTGLITTDNNWNGVPGVSGFLGANHRRDRSRSADRSPSTTRAQRQSPTRPIRPASAQGGVAEFEIADPVVAIKGSTTAGRPEHRDLRQHHRADEHPRRLQPSRRRWLRRTTPSSRSPSSTASHRPDRSPICRPGTWPTRRAGRARRRLVTPVSVTLPAAANNQPVVQMRVITTDATRDR